MGGGLCFYGDLNDLRAQARQDLDHADVALATSYCPEGASVCDFILQSKAGIKAFYDLDTPVTLSGLSQGKQLDYLPTRGLGDFDLVLSYTGGRALEELQTRLGARCVAPLYGSVDPETHKPARPDESLRASLSYLGTYAADRQAALQDFFLKPAERLPEQRFLIGGAQYPDNFPWMRNIGFVRHVPPPMHAAFFSSCRATLNITRAAMASYGYCPSGRLFEAAACGAPLLTDSWEGLDCFFEPGREVLRVQSTEDVVEALSCSDGELQAMARAARERTLNQHTGDHRVADLEKICERVLSMVSQPTLTRSEN